MLMLSGIPIICSSVNREGRIVRLSMIDGLYPNLEEVQGLRSPLVTPFGDVRVGPAQVRSGLMGNSSVRPAFRRS
jgi:hypothetical protein